LNESSEIYERASFFQADSTTMKPIRVQALTFLIAATVEMAGKTLYHSVSKSRIFVVIPPNFLLK
jgi:hypothetical protein